MASQSHRPSSQVPDNLMDPDLLQPTESVGSQPVVPHFPYSPFFAAVNTVEEEDASEEHPFRSDVFAKSPYDPTNLLSVPGSRGVSFNQGKEENSEPIQFDRSPFNNRPRRTGYQGLPPAANTTHQLRQGRMVSEAYGYVEYSLEYGHLFDPSITGQRGASTSGCIVGNDVTDDENLRWMMKDGQEMRMGGGSNRFEEAVNHGLVCLAHN